MDSPTRPAEPLFRGVGSSPLPLLDKAFASLARRFQIGLLSRLSEDLPVAVHAVRSTTLGTALGTLDPGSEDAVYSVLRFGSVRTPGFIAFDNHLMRPLIQRMLGSGSLRPEVGPARPLSLVELRIANRVCQAVAAALQAEGREELMPRLAMGTATNGARHLDDGDMGTSSVVCMLHFGEGGELGRAALCVPNFVADALVAQHPDAAPASGARPKRVELDRVNPIQVDLVVSQGLAPMSLRELRALSLGDLIYITAADACTVSANGRPFALGQLGATNGERAVRLTARL